MTWKAAVFRVFRPPNSRTPLFPGLHAGDMDMAAPWPPLCGGAMDVAAPWPPLCAGAMDMAAPWPPLCAGATLIAVRPREARHFLRGPISRCPGYSRHPAVARTPASGAHMCYVCNLVSRPADDIYGHWEGGYSAGRPSYPRYIWLTFWRVGHSGGLGLI